MTFLFFNRTICLFHSYVLTGMLMKRCYCSRYLIYWFFFLILFLMLLKNLHLISIVLLPLLCRVLKCMALVIGPKFLNMWEQEEGNSVLTTIMLHIWTPLAFLSQYDQFSNHLHVHTYFDTYIILFRKIIVKMLTNSFHDVST